MHWTTIIVGNYYVVNYTAAKLKKFGEWREEQKYSLQINQAYNIIESVDSISRDGPDRPYM